MADTAFQIQYRQETIAGFEQTESLFRSCSVHESVVKGNQATFLIGDTGAAEAVTRGTNGLIPARAENLTQVTATLEEWHDKPQRTSFNIFASQGNDARAKMQSGSIAVLNRKIDDLSIAALSAGTQTMTEGGTASLAMFQRAIAILGNADVPVDEEDHMFCAISNAARNYLMQIPEFARADYVDAKALNMPVLNGRKIKRWAGINFFVSNRLSGRTTSAEKLLLWHKNAFGTAMNKGEMSVSAGYNDEHDYYYARASMYEGVKVLQNSGIVVITHNGAGIAAS